jgi:hypothetical protein
MTPRRRDATALEQPIEFAAHLSAAAYGMTVILAALDPWLWALPILLIGAGVGMTISSASANAVLQVGAPPRLLGQSISLYMLAMRGDTAIGGLLSGATVSVLGVRKALVVNGVLAVATQLAIAHKWFGARQALEVMCR